MLGDSECAIASYEESLAVRRGIGDMSRVSLSLANVALMAVLNGDLTRGSALFAESAQIAAGIGDKRHMCFASDGLAWIAFVERRWEEADTHSRLSLRLARELGMTSMLVGGIVCLGAIAAATGDAARAARLTAACVRGARICACCPVGVAKRSNRRCSARRPVPPEVAAFESPRCHRRDRLRCPKDARHEMSDRRYISVPPPGVFGYGLSGPGCDVGAGGSGVPPGPVANVSHGIDGWKPTGGVLQSQTPSGKTCCSCAHWASVNVTE